MVSLLLLNSSAYYVVWIFSSGCGARWRFLSEFVFRMSQPRSTFNSLSAGLFLTSSSSALSLSAAPVTVTVALSIICPARVQWQWPTPWKIWHYLDNFLTLGLPASPVCYNNLQVCIQLCSNLGLPLHPDKLEGPSACPSILAIELNSSTLQARLPPQKRERIITLLGT